MRFISRLIILMSFIILSGCQNEDKTDSLGTWSFRIIPVSSDCGVSASINIGSVIIKQIDRKIHIESQESNLIGIIDGEDFSLSGRTAVGLGADCIVSGYWNGNGRFTDGTISGNATIRIGSEEVCLSATFCQMEVFFILEQLE